MTLLDDVPISPIAPHLIIQVITESNVQIIAADWPIQTFLIISVVMH